MKKKSAAAANLKSKKPAKGKGDLGKKKNESLAERKGFRFFLNSGSVGALVGKSVLLLLIPYAYLFLCGAIFDALLHWYFMTTFIFFSMIVLYLIAIAMIAWAIARYCRRKA